MKNLLKVCGILMMLYGVIKLIFGIDTPEEGAREPKSIRREYITLSR